MNHTSHVPVTTIVAWSLWTLSLLVLLIAFVAMPLGHPHAAMLAGYTSGVLAPAAAVATIRGYTIRICGLIRATSGLTEGSATPELHRV